MLPTTTVTCLLCQEEGDIPPSPHLGSCPSHRLQIYGENDRHYHNYPFDFSKDSILDTCMFCDHPTKTLKSYQCFHGKIIVQFYQKPFITFFMLYQKHVYSMAFKNNDLIISKLWHVDAGFSGTSVLLKFTHPIFPPEQAVQKLEQFLKLLAFS
jgi:hypothetical protein